jgi:hypothetical protein
MPETVETAKASSERENAIAKSAIQPKKSSLSADGVSGVLTKVYTEWLAGVVNLFHSDF